jgi:Putative auto-transporter adhesin, head GIN domain
MKGKILWNVLALWLLSVPLWAQQKEPRQVGGFEAIDVQSGIDVYLRQGNTESVEVEAQGVKMKDIVVEVANGRLQMFIDQKLRISWGRRTGVKIYVTFKNLKEIRARGGSDIFSQEKLNIPNLYLSLSGGADAHLELRSDLVEIYGGGGSDAVLVGQTLKLVAEFSGGSDLKASNFVAKQGEISVSGGSDAYVYITKEARLKASGGSDIHWEGDAQVISQNTSGGSDIRKR